ncbi:MAG: DUF4296 domain-containing protein [Ginsengibacter sp.]
MKNLFGLLFLSIIISCDSGNKPPSNIIQPKEMQSILWDVMRAQTLANEIAIKDSSINTVAKTNLFSVKIFKIHKTDSTTFSNSYSWYIKHPDILKLIFDSLYVQKERVHIIEEKRIEQLPLKIK